MQEMLVFLLRRRRRWVRSSMLVLQMLLLPLFLPLLRAMCELIKVITGR